MNDHLAAVVGGLRSQQLGLRADLTHLVARQSDLVDRLTSVRFAPDRSAGTGEL